MRKVFGYIAVLAALTMVVWSCSSKGDDPAGNVPDGVLRIFADKTSIAADGADCVTFRVMFGADDVSHERTMHLEWSSEDGNVVEMAAGANVFSTTAAGNYRFKACLYSGGYHWSDNEVIVSASGFEGLKAYTHKILGEQFTSVGCTSCPSLSTAIAEVQKELPGVLVPLSFHMDFQMADPMAIQATDYFYNTYGFTGLPFFNLNMRKRSGGIGTFKTDIIEGIEMEKKTFPAVCGVAIDTEYDEGSRKLDIITKITSNASLRFKYHIFLVEDGIEGFQSGASGMYVHNNVVRKMFASDITGLNINSKKPFTPGVEVTASNSAVLDYGWNPDNMRVVVAAMITGDSGMTFTCNNVNECRLGESVDYLLDE